MSKKTQWSLPSALRHTESVRLSHDRLMLRGGAGVGSSWAFKQSRFAAKCVTARARFIIKEEGEIPIDQVHQSCFYPTKQECFTFIF